MNAPQNVQDARSEEFVSKSMIYPCRMFAFVVEAYSEQSFATLATRHAGNSPPSSLPQTAPNMRICSEYAPKTAYSCRIIHSAHKSQVMRKT